MGGGEIARILKSLAEGQHAAFAAVIVFRGPMIAARVDRRQRDGAIADQRVGLQAVTQGGEIAQRLDSGPGLTH